MTKHVRFWPPDVSLTPDVRWVLARAFRPVEPSLHFRSSPGLSFDLPRQLGLLARIGARVPQDLLELDLGGEYPQASTALRLIVARSLALERTIKTISGACIDSAIECCFIKGAALALTRLAPFASRGASDVDVLVTPDAASCLQDALVSQGFQPRGEVRPEYHLAVLEDNRGGVIEIHTAIPGLSLDGNAGLPTLDQLKMHGVLRPILPASSLLHVPSAEFLLAHTVAHGIAHHGFLPLTYPLPRMLADVSDLEAAGTTLSGRVLDWVQPDVTAEEVLAIRSVVSHLRNGTFEDIWHGDAPESRMLRHCVLGSIDERYARGLWFHYQFYTRVAQYRAWGPRKFATRVWHRTGGRVEALRRLGWTEYRRQYGLEARGHDRAEFKWSSLPATFEVLRRSVGAKIRGQN